MANSVNTEAAASVEQSLNSQEAFFLKFRKQIVGGVVAILVIIAAVAVYNSQFAAPREDKASTALAKAQALFMQGEYQKALNGDKATEGFLTIADSYSCTDAANLANLYAGICYANLGKWQEAVNTLEEFSAKNDAMISPAATATLGNAYANIGNIDKAVETLKKAAKMADSKAEDGVNNSLSPTYLIQAARLLESQNKNEEALEIYKSVKAKYVGSAAQMDIDKYIERASAK